MTSVFNKSALFLIIGGLNFSIARAETTNEPPVIELKLNDYLQQVLQQNQDVQAQILETEVNRHKAKGEYGIFEPSLDVSASRVINQRTNNIQQQAEQNGQGYFSERNSIYDSGLEQLVPTGGKIQMGYTLSDLDNNVNPYGSAFSETNNQFIRQYQTFVGVTFTQPLLKDAGYSTTMAGIRVAALDSDIAFQQYRRQLMLTVYQAEGSYWNLYFAQEQIRFFNDSVSVAQAVLDDSQEKLKAGQDSELDVMEAQSALALRETKRNEAVQGYYDALGHLRALSGEAPLPYVGNLNVPGIRVADDPHCTNVPPTYADGYGEVVAQNPDYLIQQEKMNQEAIRLGFAKNQMLPELDFKAAYGFNGLGATPGDSWNLAATGDFPSWTLGLELNIPLAGNIKGRNLYKAAKLSMQEAYLSLEGVQTQIANSLNTSIQKAQAWQQSIRSYQTVVNYNDELLKTELKRLKAGTVDGHRVLESESDLLDSRQDLANALTQYRNALLQVELNSGVLLENRGLDISRKTLQQQTEQLLHHLDANEAAAVREFSE